MGVSRSAAGSGTMHRGSGRWAGACSSEETRSGEAATAGATAATGTIAIVVVVVAAVVVVVVDARAGAGSSDENGPWPQRWEERRDRWFSAGLWDWNLSPRIIDSVENRQAQTDVGDGCRRRDEKQKQSPSESASPVAPRGHGHQHMFSIGTPWPIRFSPAPSAPFPFPFFRCNSFILANTLRLFTTKRGAHPRHLPVPHTLLRSHRVQNASSPTSLDLLHPFNRLLCISHRPRCPSEQIHKSRLQTAFEPLGSTVFLRGRDPDTPSSQPMRVRPRGCLAWVIRLRSTGAFPFPS
ncbi:hypothetical protein K474DRAFT_607721 [Panus rudis PR-1116 ss-1]|nr:hypothetical protein K474DRAFT_607721 [Panus rudis PR-1116 ss-1]